MHIVARSHGFYSLLTYLFRFTSVKQIGLNKVKWRRQLRTAGVELNPCMHAQLKDVDVSFKSLEIETNGHLVIFPSSQNWSKNESTSISFSKAFFLSSCWSTRNSNPVMTSSAGGAKGCSDHRFRAPPAYTAQLPALHQHRANNQYRTANQI